MGFSKQLPQSRGDRTQACASYVYTPCSASIRAIAADILLAIFDPPTPIPSSNNPQFNLPHYPISVPHRAANSTICFPGLRKKRSLRLPCKTGTKRVNLTMLRAGLIASGCKLKPSQKSNRSPAHIEWKGLEPSSIRIGSLWMFKGLRCPRYSSDPSHSIDCNDLVVNPEIEVKSKNKAACSPSVCFVKWNKGYSVDSFCTPDRVASICAESF